MFSLMLDACRAAAGISLTLLNKKGKTMHQNSRICLTLKISLSGTFILVFIITTVSGLGSVVSRLYQYIDMRNTWQAAQNYCRSIDNHTDLATIYVKSEADRFNLKNYNAWVGLSRNNDIWTWQLGGPLDPTWWTLSKPQSYQNCAFARYNNDSVYGAHCETRLFFICGNTYKVITQSKKWSEAQDYCRENYNSQLASFVDRNVMKSTASLMDFPIWIGLYRDGQKWTWTGGLSNYTNWATDEPGSNGNCVSISSLKKEMATQDCNTLLPAICYRDNLVLIKENKTWNEALEHCQALRSPTNQEFRYDLVSIQPQDYDYVKNKLVEANVGEVWTGLRFLAGEWLWVNGADMKYSDLPLCPPIVQRCGALSMSGTGSMEIRDCTERKNFMCYRKV